MSEPISRRSVLKGAALGLAAAVTSPEMADAGHARPGWVSGCMTGAGALVEALLTEGVDWVFGIPGAQENELWDEFKVRHLAYVLATHEMSAAGMADGYARSTGRPGVLCVVPGPGVTNALTGIGEALLDSVPMVCIVGDVARGEKYRAFQVHDLPQVGLLKQVCKAVFPVQQACEIPGAVRQAFHVARSYEPGPTAVVVPYNLLIEAAKYHCPPPGPPEIPFDDAAFGCALNLLSQCGKGGRPLRVGIYAGMGCMDSAELLVRAAELLQAPVATSVSGKGVINECHPLAVGWGYGPQGTRAAEAAFKTVELVLAIGVRYSEVSTAFYSIPPHRVLHVDANAHNLGAVVKAEVCVHADSGVFLSRLLEHADQVRRPADPALLGLIKQTKALDAQENAKIYGTCAVDPLALVLALRRNTCPEALVFVDVSMTEHWAAEAFTVYQPRTYFNPTDNQSMGWSIPAAIGAQRAHPGRPTVVLTGDGCFLMSAVEISTAARECLPVKFFVLDDQAYHYMQTLQKQAYKRTTATVLARLDYAALAKGFGLNYLEILCNHDLDAGVQAALAHPGPVLVRVVTDYGNRPLRWLHATKQRFTAELSTEQKIRFLARLGARSLDPHPRND
jgi:acetolactate synthase I/II/III large subunit